MPSLFCNLSYSYFSFILFTRSLFCCRVDIEVMAKLEEIAGFAVKKTGIFHNQPTYYKNKLKKKAKIAEGIDRQASNFRLTWL